MSLLIQCGLYFISVLRGLSKHLLNLVVEMLEAPVMHGPYLKSL